MNATTAESLIHGKAIHLGDTADEGLFYDRIVEVDGSDDSSLFAFIDACALLCLYLGPVVAFGYLVAPVVVRLLNMPVPR